MSAVLAGLLLAAAGAFLYAWLVEPRRGEVREVTLACGEIPAAFAGFRILLLTDFHGKVRHRGEPIESLAARLRPDLIVVGGDLADDRRGLERVLGTLGRLQAPHGVVFVPGNHEYRLPRALRDEVFRRLPELGIVVLQNRVYTLQREGETLHVLGVDWARRARWPETVPRPFVVVAHGPQAVLEAEPRGALAVLAGHTHGGQVCLPGFGALRSKTRLPRHLEQGVHRVGRTWLVVSRGIGESLLPLRFACPPEIVVVSLQATA